MTRDEAIEVLTEAGQAGDDAFPLLEAAIACAIHDQPFRDPRRSALSPPTPPNGWRNGLQARKAPTRP